MTNDELVIELRQAEMDHRKITPEYANLIRQMADAFERCPTPLTCEMPLRELAAKYPSLVSFQERIVSNINRLEQ